MIYRPFRPVYVLFVLLISASTYGATRYVKPTGNGLRDGSTWANAGPPAGQTAIDWLNATMKNGDTVFFGTGLYMGQVHPPNQSNIDADGDGLLGSLDRTVYACSSFVTNYPCTLSAATLFDHDAGWSLYSGSIYSRVYTLDTFAYHEPRTAHAGGQDTTKLVSRTSVGGLTQGSYWHDEATNTIYVWCTDNANPSTHRIFVSRRPTVHYRSTQSGTYQDFVTYWGLVMFWSEYAAIHLDQSGADSTFVDHCKMAKIGSQPLSNESCVGSEALGNSGPDAYLTDAKYNRMRSCIGYEIDEPNGSNDRGDLMVTYSQSYATVESCLAVGVGGVNFKNRADGGRSDGNRFIFNTVIGGTGYTAWGAGTLCHQTRDSMYGNYFLYLFDFGVYGAANGTEDGEHFICNNTFYGVNKYAVYGYETALRNSAKPNWLKYNLIVDNDASSPGNLLVMNQTAEDTSWVVDSNLYWNVGTGVQFRLWDGTYTWAQWQTRGDSVRHAGRTAPYRHDIHSTYNTVNPGLTNPAARDFSRPSAPPEMDLWYGGKHWTNFGAWQPDGPPPPLALNSIAADSVRCDYSGENDSLRFRFQTSSQTWPDSVIVAISLTSALPSYTQGSDRWARPYLGALRLDTLRISRLINETDTVIVGGWVRDIDSGFSAGAFDTIVLTQLVVAPSGLTSLTLDSLHCDFSGENDSLRISFSTGTETFPDSVVFAITTNGTLPTVSSSDRLARPYSASLNATIPLVRTILETDTLILGGWVKEGGVYSSARFDTLILTQPPPSQLAPLFFELVRYDFSGESDSLRIRFSTGIETFPDSVVFAITTNGTLPTVTSTDRTAIPYAASQIDTIPLVRTITEPDTLILGAWVKDGSTYSSARYDTLIMEQISPLVAVIIDSTRSDYSGEADSLRIRYTTSAQTFPDSVILALSTTTTLPTPTSTDRWARAFVASRTDTSYAIRAIVESDTVIIGAWTKDGAAYSSARYDTVILIQPATNPVVSVFLDSVRCDYSGEADSLRVRYSTGTQTFPDSVIYAISLTGALPTQSQTSDRFARRYFASRTDSAIILKFVAESDTLIVGTWVKDANQYSTGRYDTLALIQPPTSPLAAFAIDSVRNDFSGETDSIRIRYTTSSQTFPDSVILALTNDGTLPTTVSPDRWARSYVASRTDTTRITRAIAEPDTIIIGAWVKDVAGISTARFDTLIYAVPAATPPDPLALLAIDSIRSDFTGESDSLRVRWQTGTQTTPDSVVFALSLSGTLPGINASDRFATAFVSNVADTTVIIRAITEADTVIIGGWVKEGAAWSTARYDTVVLFSASPDPLVTLALDSLHNDYSVENDSIRIRFTTGTQTWPDSVVFALTTDGTQPTLSSADRFSRVYAASAIDTVIISRSIIESATLIVAAWVREGGSWSPALYDTVSFSLPAPQPLVFAIIDSVRYDYAGEYDSLRMVYRTGQESWPDSVIIAVSFTSALPTVNSPDRWARPYVAGNSQSFFFSRLINEPDTIIIGGWVKDGSQLSTPIYDTIPLMPVLVFSNVTVNDISSSSASLSWTTSLLATSQVEYGPTAQYGFATTRDANKVLNHTVVVTGLSAATTYHFRLLCDPGNGVQQSGDSSFVTSLATGGEVAVSDEAAWFVTDSSALIVWTTSVPATSQVQYGARGRYKKSTPEDKSYAVGHSVYLHRLTPNTKYTYRVVSADDLGTRVYGQDLTFTTSPKNQPNLASGKPVASRIDGSSTSPLVLTDDIIDTCGATAAVWVSDDNRNQPQWVEIDLGIDSLVSEVIIYWACDTLGETWLTSQQYSVQAWNGVDFVDAAVVVSPEIDHASINGFPDTLRTTKLRIYQPPNLGSADHPARLALTEVQIYGTEQFTPTDTTDLQTSSPSAFNVSQPILRIENLPDSLPAGSGAAAKTTADRFYYFAVAEDTNMITIIASSPAVPEEAGTVTSWKVPYPLEPNRTYYWQATVDSVVFSKVYAFTVYPQTHAYPNPFKMDQGSTVVFTGIPSGSNLIMISISGEVVKRWTNNTGEDIVWDGMNESGHTVSSGVYLWYIENSSIKGQLIVLR